MPSGQFLAATDTGGIVIKLETSQVEAIAAFLRVVNALENIRSAIDSGETAKVASSDESAILLLSLLDADAIDAVEVLKARNLHPDAVEHIEAAIAFSQAAAAQKDTLVCRFFFCRVVPADRGPNINSAIAELSAARDSMTN